MKKATLILGLALGFGVFTFSSCKKEECHECHYENELDEEVELGERCGDDLEALERDGYETGGTIYEVHCHEH